MNKCIAYMPDGEREMPAFVSAFLFSHDFETRSLKDDEVDLIVEMHQLPDKIRIEKYKDGVLKAGGYYTVRLSSGWPARGIFNYCGSLNSE